jgi:hypothetical protein
MKPVAPRPASIEESAVVRRALEAAPLPRGTEDFGLGSDPLIVVGECECGCRSVQFETNSQEAAHRVADGVAHLPGGERVDIIVWAKGKSISGLEIVDYGQSNGRFPLPDSVCSWESASASQPSAPADGPASLRSAGRG